MANSDLQAGLAVNDASSGNAVNGRRLLRMKLEWEGMEYMFAVNPDDYTQSEPNKATVTQTKGGAWIDAWGEGIKEITIKGTTGVGGSSKTGTADGDIGYNRWKQLRNLIQHVYDSVEDGQKVALMKFYNFTDKEFYYVYPAQGGIELYRSKSRPHIYQYTLHLWAVRRLGEAETERQALGNPVKYLDTSNSPDYQELVSLAQQVHAGTANITQIVKYVKDHPGLGTGA